MKFIDTTKLSPEQHVKLLERENADLKLQLEKRQNIEYEYENWARLGNYAVYLKAVVSEIPPQFQKNEHADKGIVGETFKDFFEMAGVLTATMLLEKLEEQSNQEVRLASSNPSAVI